MQALLSLHQNNNLLLVHDKHCYLSRWSPASEIDMLLITNLPGTPRVAAWSLSLASRQQYNISSTCCEPATNLPSLDGYTMPSPCYDPATNLPWKAYSWHGRGTAGERHGNGMVCVNQKRPHCVNQMGKSQSNPLAERNGRGTAGERHGMCESNKAALCKSNGKVTI